MPILITYCGDVKSMHARGLLLSGQGKYPDTIKRNAIGRLSFGKFFCPVAYNENTSIGYGYISQTDLDAGLLADIGIKSLAEGANGIELYDSMTPENKALYETVKPPIKLLDSEGNETGETRFNYHTIIDGGY